MKIIAHRGASGYAPENTLAAFRKALEQKADMIEFDVHSLPSGEVILMHDLLVNRTTDGMGYVADHSFEGLRNLDAGDNETVPTLQEVIELIGRQVPLNIELKGPGCAPAVAGVVRAYLDKGWNANDFIASSFNHHELKRFKQLLPEVDIVALMDGVPLNYAAYAEELGAFGIGPGHEFVNLEYVLDAHSRGLKVFVWTVNDPVEVERMHRLGVDGIFTDHPAVTRRAAIALSPKGVAHLY